MQEDEYQYILSNHFENVFNYSSVFETSQNYLMTDLFVKHQTATQANREAAGLQAFRLYHNILMQQTDLKA